MRLLTPRMMALHVLGLAAATVAVLLGVWQYHAWQTGRELAARDLANAEPVPLATVMSADDAFPATDVGRPVTLAGAWVPDGTVLVDDRSSAGHDPDGRWLVTPLAVCAGDAGCSDAPAMLVVRGRIADGDAVPAAPTGRARVTGTLQPGEGTGLPDPDPDDDVLPELRIPSAIQHVDQDLYGGYVIAREMTPSGAGTGLEPVRPETLPEPGTFTSLRNLLYAVEWWLFAGFAVFLWWRWVRDEIDRDRAWEDDAAEIASTP